MGIYKRERKQEIRACHLFLYKESSMNFCFWGFIFGNVVKKQSPYFVALFAIKIF